MAPTPQTEVRFRVPASLFYLTGFKYRFIQRQSRARARSHQDGRDWLCSLLPCSADPWRSSRPRNRLGLALPRPLLPWLSSQRQERPQGKLCRLGREPEADLLGQMSRKEIQETKGVFRGYPGIYSCR